MMDQNTLVKSSASGASLGWPAVGVACLLLMWIAAFDPAPVFGEGRPGGGHKMLGGFAADFDTDQDGSVSREEFERGTEALFAELDLDGDGSLSEDELPRFRGPRRGRGPKHGAMAGVIVARAADGDDDREVTSVEWQSFLDSLEVGADGAISEDSLRAVLPRPPGMSGEPGGGRQPSAGRLTRLLDRDGDSLLETEDLNAIFAELDQDGDGALTIEELPRFRGRRGPPSR